MSRHLPEYDNPPVTEVVLGIQFDALERFGLVHPGLYWDRVKSKFPNFEPRAPLAAADERFPVSPSAEATARVSNVPPLPRSWFLDGKGNRLIQLQADHFIHNWRKVTGQEEYPRYSSISGEFLRHWEDFIVFAQEWKIGDVRPNHWEVTYVNHIDQGQGWESLADLGDLFSAWSGGSSEQYLPAAETILLNTTYAFPENLGRLYISLQRAVRQSDSVECLLLKLTAKGRLDAAEEIDLPGALDLGHEWIVRGFTDFTTAKAHSVWQRQDK